MDYQGIYITLSKDVLELMETFQQQNIDTAKLAFIDGISRLYSICPVVSPMVHYIDGPLSTDAILETVTNLVPAIKSEKKFVFLDSITTVLLYNSLERTLRFSRLLSALLNKQQVRGVIVSVSMNAAQKNLLAEIQKENCQVIEL
jgi:KaiC/GvpD/RAD55 family RecA-like ATPase